MKEYSLLELIDELNQFTKTSHDLTKLYLDCIEEHNHAGKALNAIACVNPEAFDIADALDRERRVMGPRSLLHGVHIIVKDNINTCDKMKTTASSLALSDLFAPYDATIIKKLRDAGAIILGKANLSEFAYFMSYDNMPSGFGSYKGQVINPYDKSIDPLGSSTGSAVAVAANMAPISVGTETNGSLMAPALANSITAIKPTFGLVSRYGIIPISPFQDTAGPMGRSVRDCAVLLQYLIGEDINDPVTLNLPKKTYDFIHAYEIPLEHKKIGFISFEKHPVSEEEIIILEEAKEVFRKLKCKVVNVSFKPEEMANDKSLKYEFKYALNKYLDSVKGSTKMTSLKDIIEFNLQDKERRMKYGQSILEASETTSGTLTEPEYVEIRKVLVKEAARFQSLMEDKGLDCLITTRRSSYAPIGGNPSIAVPAKALIDFTPRSLIFVGKRFDDELLISFANAYETATLKRIRPIL